MSSPAAAHPAPPQVRRNGRRVTLGRFATAEEAALCYARSPEGSNFAMLAAFKDWSSGGEEGGKEGGKEGVALSASSHTSCSRPCAPQTQYCSAAVRGHGKWG